MQHEATLPIEHAHRPRPFGCGLRVTVGSVRTRTVLDPGRVLSFFVTVVPTTTSDSKVAGPVGNLGAVRPARKPIEEVGSAAEGSHMYRRDELLAEGVFDLVEQALVVAVGLWVWRAKDLGELLE